MLQIKTIREQDAATFDEAVNKALADGWGLVRRLSGPDYIAELEKVIITPEERTCDNCVHCDNHPDAEPCASCSEDCDKWEAEA